MDIFLLLFFFLNFILSMHDTGCLGLVHWDDPEGGYGEGGGRRVQDGEHMYTCGRFILTFFFLREKEKEKNSSCYL